jgi:hypothetical protein
MKLNGDHLLSSQYKDHNILKMGSTYIFRLKGCNENPTQMGSKVQLLWYPGGSKEHVNEGQTPNKYQYILMFNDYHSTAKPLTQHLYFSLAMQKFVV